MDEWLVSEEGKVAILEERFQKRYDEVVAVLNERKFNKRLSK
jgi:hypothetical protein